MRIEVTVKAGTKKNEVSPAGDNRYKVSVKEKAVEGRANEAVREALAEHFGVARSRVLFLQGLKSKTKRFEILV